MDRRLLSVYLNDHAALAVAAVELAKRAAGAHAGTPFGDLAATLVPELESQRDALARVMKASGVRANPLKTRGAWVGEKLGRLKLNGRVRSPSPLAPVVEAEGLLATVGAFALLWQGLDALPGDGDGVAGHIDVDVAALAATARGRLTELEAHRLDLLRGAISGS